MSVLLFILFCAIVFLVEGVINRRRSRSVSAGGQVIRPEAISDSTYIDWHADMRPPSILKFGAAPSPKKIRVLLVDDHEILRRGLASLLKAEPDLEVAGEASSGESAVNLARSIRPDVVLMDICMPGMGGVQATKLIHDELPEIRVIGLSVLEQAESADSIRKAGAIGYLTKGEASPDAMFSVIRTAA